MKLVHSVRSMRWPLGGLYWRLTVSYFLVALVAVLAVTAYMSLRSLVSAGGSTARPPLESVGDKTNVPELATYLEQSPPDRDALGGWAWRLLVGVRLPLGVVTLAQVLDANGRPIVSSAAAGTPIAALVATPEAQAVLHAAMAGDQRPENLRRTLADGQTMLAVPILPDEPRPRVVGIFFAIYTAPGYPATKVLSNWLAPYLAQQPPNLDALRGWLWAVAHGPAVSAGGAAITPRALVVQVLDADGQPLVSAAAPGIAAQAILTEPQAQATIQGALAGRQPATTLMHTNSQAAAIEAVPIRAFDGHVIGAVAVVYDPASAAYTLDVQDVWSDFSNRLATGFVFLLLATLVGTLAGALIALTLRQRLRRITTATDAWSRGELQIEVRDRSRDELGQLARRLNAMANQLQALLTTRQELAVVEERNRLARELHDSVKQHVFATALLVRSARKQLARSPDAAAQHLSEAEALAGQTQAELTTLIRALRPAAIADKGLVAVLREYLGDWSRRTGIAAELRIQGERATPLEVEEALFRVAQEALTNAARHSGATAVELRLVWEDDALHLAIADDGQGFDMAHAAGKGLGLASMRERVEALHGSLAIESASAGTGGTTVTARVPLTSQPAADTMEASHG